MKDDDFADKLFRFAYLPWVKAKGKTVVVKLLLIIFGFIWIAPMVFLVVVPMLCFYLLPRALWQSIEEQEL